MSSRGKTENRISIHDHPAKVDAKLRIGDWEIDLIMGKDRSEAMVTIVERASKFTVSAQINDTSTAILKARPLSCWRLIVRAYLIGL